MATQPDRTVTDVATLDADDAVVTTSGRWVLPLVHTSVDAAMVAQHGGHRILLTIDTAQIETPPVEHLAFYVGLGALVAAGLVEPPIAAALGVGHLLIDLTRRPGLDALAEALEEA